MAARPRSPRRPGERWRAVIAPTLDAAQPALRQLLTTHGVSVGEVAAEQPASASVGVAVGISEALYGVGETGTLVVADGLADRLVRMLAPKHIVLLDIKNMLPSLDEAGERLRTLAIASEGPGQLHHLHHRPEPHGGHRDEPDRRRARPRRGPHRGARCRASVREDDLNRQDAKVRQETESEDTSRARG